MLGWASEEEMGQLDSIDNREKTGRLHAGRKMESGLGGTVEGDSWEIRETRLRKADHQGVAKVQKVEGTKKRNQQAGQHCQKRPGGKDKRRRVAGEWTSAIEGSTTRP